MRRLGIAQHRGNGAGFERLLHGPQQARRLLERDGHEAVARQAEAFQTMAIEPAMFALMGGEPTPQQRAALLGVAQAPQRQRQREAHGGRLVAIGARGDVMQA